MLWNAEIEVHLIMFIMLSDLNEIASQAKNYIHTIETRNNSRKPLLQKLIRSVSGDLVERGQDSPSRGLFRRNRPQSYLHRLNSPREPNRNVELSLLSLTNKAYVLSVSLKCEPIEDFNDYGVSVIVKAEVLAASTPYERQDCIPRITTSTP